MKKIGNLMIWDMRFQWKYGFYLLYMVLTAVYLFGLFYLPEPWVKRVGAILIFSDPAAMGLFFMGAIVLLERSQRIPYAFAVAPISALKYIIAKAMSLCIISLIVAAILAAAAETGQIFHVLAGTALSSVIFTLLGVMIAAVSFCSVCAEDVERRRRSKG